MSDQQPAQSSDGLRAQAVRGAGQAMTAALIVLAAAVGLALWQQGRLDAAGPHLERAAALRPGDEDTRGLLALFRAHSNPPAPR